MADILKMLEMFEMNHEFAPAAQRDLDEIIAALNATATPPEDAALADEIEWPVYHAQGMGCGLEDRGITDRYDACQYGLQEAVDQCALSFDNWIQFHYLPQLAALRARAVPIDDVIEKIEEYGGHRENEGGSYATFQKSEARRYRAEADEVLGEIRALLAASKGCAV